MKISKLALQSVVLAVVAILLVGGSLYSGYRIGQQDPKEITVKSITNIDDPNVSADFGVFWQVWEKLKEQHIEGATLKDKDMVYGAVAGLVDSLKDPYTVFFPPVEAKKFEQDVSGHFGGIGAEIGSKDGQLMVIAPVKDSPAELAGLKPKDKILKVDDTVVEKMDVNNAVTLIRGEIGTRVVLTIMRDGWKASQQFTITRAEIKTPTLDWSMVGGDLLHIKLYAFNENASSLFYRAIVDGAAKGANGIILDLRNDPGGYLEVAVNLAGWFVPRGTVITTEASRNGNDRLFRTSGNGALEKVPVVVLINGGSASASEILAGALRDINGSKLVGEKSFGKGTVQEVQNLKDGSSLKITVGKWLLPKGSAINKTGLTPDVEVKWTEEDYKKNPDNDPQLNKAVEVLKGQLTSSK
ncbi:MAG: S41 family peptidase [bacterium]|nr:S41 family peptidase [bacterium]